MGNYTSGYKRGIQDAEKVCLMMSVSLMKAAGTMSGDALGAASVVANALTQAAKSIRTLEPGFVSSEPNQPEEGRGQP